MCYPYNTSNVWNFVHEISFLVFFFFLALEHKLGMFYVSVFNSYIVSHCFILQNETKTLININVGGLTLAQIILFNSKRIYSLDAQEYVMIFVQQF